MPARRELTLEEYDAREDGRREQARLGMRRLRARRRATSQSIEQLTQPVNTTVSTTNGVALTPPTPARHSVPPQSTTPLPPKGGSPRHQPLAVPKPNKSGALIDLLRAAGVECELLEKHHAALKRTRLSAAEVAEVYIAIAEGRFGDDWLCDNVNVERAIAAWPNYQNRKLRGPRRPRSESPEAIAARVLGGVLNGRA